MKNWKFLLILFISLIIIKSLLVSLVLAPSMFSDEYEYAKMAQSFWHEHDFKVHNNPGIMYPPLYSIIISPTYFFEDMRIVFLLIKIINAIISSLTIIPAYLLAKEFMNKKRAQLTTMIVGILPATFSSAPYVMSENLFVPLFLFSFYGLYKTLTKKSLPWGIITSILIALTFFTRTLGLGLIAVTGLMFIISIFLFKKNNSDHTYKKQAIILAALLVLIGSLIIIKNIILDSPILQHYSLIPETLNEYGAIQLAGCFLFWFFAYAAYMAIATGFFPILKILNNPKLNSKKEKVFFTLFALTALAGLIMVAKHNINIALFNTTIFSWLSGRPIGRYIEYLFPLIIIGGFASIKDSKINKKLTRTLCALCIVSITFLSTFTLLPVNNEAISLFGILRILYECFVSTISLISAHYFLFIAINALLVILILWFVIRNYNKNILTLFLIIFFVATNAFNYAAVIENSKEYWYKGEQMQLGLWINDNKEFTNKTFLIDERYGGKIIKTNQDALYEKGYIKIESISTIIGFWLNYRTLLIGDVKNLKNVDYVISKSKLDLPLIKQTKNGIYLYIVPEEP